MTETQTIYTAVCGQRCGTVQVPAADTANCPQCGHPLTEPPKPITVTKEPAAPTSAETIAGAPVVTAAEIVESAEALIASALARAGYPAEEAAEMAASAVAQIASRKSAPAAF